MLFLDAAMRPDGDPLQASSLGISYLFLFTGGAAGAVLAGTLAEAVAPGDAAFGLAVLPVAAGVLAVRVR